MNPSLIPFVIIPVIAFGAGITLVVIAIAGKGPHDSFLFIGAALIVTGVVLPILFQIVTRPRK